MNQELTDALRRMQNYFRSYSTYGYEFRRTQLLKLRSAIYKYEKEIHAALHSDLKKSPEESWVTETGYLASEISHALKHLRSWMRPGKVSTNLLNLPSKSRIHKEPLGVVLIIGPWNYPFQLLLAPLVGAVAAGNCVMLKPSEYAPATAAVLKKIVEEVFIPEHVSLVEGEGAMVIPEMMEHFRFDHVFYTGGTQVGRKIYEMAARKLSPVTLELGGKSPCVVEEDADLRIAARRIALAKFSNAGQMCVAPDYVLVHEKIRNDFLDELKKATEQFYSSDAAGCYNYGRIINSSQFNRIRGYLNEGNIVYGGKLDEASLFIEPTIITDVNTGSSVMKEEIFGPVLPVISFNSFEEAQSIISKNPDPLAFYVFTKSREKERTWIEKISFGGGCVNNTSWHFTNFNLPFGGRGHSGIGAYHGKFSFDLFSHHKAIMKTPLWFDPSVKYPPFKGRLNLFKKIIR